MYAFVAFGATPAVAATITAPSRSPYAVPPGPGAFAVVATGFAPMANVFVEQCDGVAPTTPQWSPTIDCDLGSAPPPASADAHGTATFNGTRIFQPFVGESPQGLFNCLVRGERPPGDHLRSFTNCQLRVSTNNASRTSDQVFLTLVLPVHSASPTTVAERATPTTARKASAPTTTVNVSLHAAAPTSARRATSTTNGAAAGKSTAAGDKAAAAVARPQHGAGSSSSGDATDVGAVAGYVCLLVGAVLALTAWYGGRKRRAA